MIIKWSNLNVADKQKIAIKMCGKFNMVKFISLLDKLEVNNNR